MLPPTYHIDADFGGRRMWWVIGIGAVVLIALLFGAVAYHFNPSDEA